MSVWMTFNDTTQFRKGDRINLALEPSPTIQAAGIAGVWCSQYFVEGDGEPWTQEEIKFMSNKPPYRIPSVATCHKIPWNGYKVASTFSGCGGSCIGYRMAGFRVVWANEFIPIAQESYRANHPDTFLDCRDIKTVEPDDILAACGLECGELDIFDGSPPCQGFSLANKNRMTGKEKVYENGVSQNNEELFYAYVKLLRGLQPKAFIAENVRGLIVGKGLQALGDFQLDMFTSQEDTILHALMDAGYIVRYQLLNAADYGTPQSRPRAIFIGVRKDLAKEFGLEPTFPKPLGYRYSVVDAIPWIMHPSRKGGPPPKIIKGEGYGRFVEMDPNEPAHTILASGGHKNNNMLWVEGSAPPPVEKSAWIDKGWGVAGWESIQPGEQHEKHFSMVKVNPDKPCPTILASHGGGLIGVVHPFERRKFSIAELKRLGGFPDDYVLMGKYAQQWERIGNSVPPPLMKHISTAVRRYVLDRIPKGVDWHTRK